MRRAVKMCETCPFRLPLTRAERRQIAAMQADEWTCHTEDGYTRSDIQCRGHWELRRKAAVIALRRQGSGA